MHSAEGVARASAADALSGDPQLAALASFAAGTVQAALLLPLNTLQTHMQHHGRSGPVTLRSMFATGGVSGVQTLYRAFTPTIVMLGARQVRAALDLSASATRTHPARSVSSP